jgi:large subunit ribosomal protein L16
MIQHLEPKKSKFSKYFRARTVRRIGAPVPVISTHAVLHLRVLECGFITATQYAAARFAINKITKRVGRCIFYAFPTKALSTRGTNGGRMGKGKGVKKIWGLSVRAGFVLCELQINSEAIGKRALQAAQHRLPIKTLIYQSL